MRREVVNRYSCCLCVLLLTPRAVAEVRAQEECTVAVVAGGATVDGRPLLWKNRDTSNLDVEIAFFSGRDYDFIGLINTNDMTQVWMGLNTAGFAIMNSESLDLDGDSLDGEGFFMKQALGICASVRDFERLLERTNTPGRSTKANFGVIDASGGAAIFETGNHRYMKFDANDRSVAPFGYVVRANFAVTGEGEGSGHVRYRRAEALFREAAKDGPLSYFWILRTVARDLANDTVNPYPLPFGGREGDAPPGYINTSNSINRHRTASCAVFHGVKPGEDPVFATMWCILGEPVCGVAIPLWPRAHGVPLEVDGQKNAPLNGGIQAIEERVYHHPRFKTCLDTSALDGASGKGLTAQLLAIEDWVFATTHNRLSSWRTVYPSSTEMREFESNVANNVVRRLAAVR